jgi:hypothetical protein
LVKLLVLKGDKCRIGEKARLIILGLASLDGASTSPRGIGLLERELKIVGKVRPCTIFGD